MTHKQREMTPDDGQKILKDYSEPTWIHDREQKPDAILGIAIAVGFGLVVWVCVLVIVGFIAW